ncbi:MAG: HNH endonuclease [Paludibacter sp.]|jgi:predicted HNH restriction endonuclease
MKKDTINNTILKYLRHLSESTWIVDEAYKFEFANYLQSNIDFEQQSNNEILEILLYSQTIKYDGGSRGIQFIQKSGREKLNTFITHNDISLFRQFCSKRFESIDWSTRSMSYTGLSAWLSSLFPDKIYPIPMIGFDSTINYLFDTDLEKFPKTGEKYLLNCQNYMKQTQDELKKYPIEEIHLKIWNKYFTENPQLNIKKKVSFEQVDWNWLTQDFHLFVHRNILKLYKLRDTNNAKQVNIIDDFEPISIEGKSKLAIHMRYERDSRLIKKIKTHALRVNPMLNCEVCGFSFFEKYGELGEGFIEAHHLKPLTETKETETTRQDIALVCSNCHRMLHKGISQINDKSIMTIDELKKILIE